MAGALQGAVSNQNESNLNNFSFNAGFNRPALITNLFSLYSGQNGPLGSNSHSQPKAPAQGSNVIGVNKDGSARRVHFRQEIVLSFTPLIVARHIVDNIRSFRNPLHNVYCAHRFNTAFPVSLCGGYKQGNRVTTKTLNADRPIVLDSDDDADDDDEQDDISIPSRLLSMGVNVNSLNNNPKGSNPPSHHSHANIDGADPSGSYSSGSLGSGRYGDMMDVLDSDASGVMGVTGLVPTLSNFDQNGHNNDDNGVNTTGKGTTTTNNNNDNNTRNQHRPLTNVSRINKELIHALFDDGNDIEDDDDIAIKPTTGTTTTITTTTTTKTKPPPPPPQSRPLFDLMTPQQRLNLQAHVPIVGGIVGGGKVNSGQQQQQQQQQKGQIYGREKPLTDQQLAFLFFFSLGTDLLNPGISASSSNTNNQRQGNNSNSSGQGGSGGEDDDFLMNHYTDGVVDHY
jgi:hypothetical protein